MAGSYRHCEGDDGSFRFDMIENMGDAYEACEMLYFMVKWLAAFCPDDCPAEQRIIMAEAAYYQHSRPSRTTTTENEP